MCYEIQMIYISISDFIAFIINKLYIKILKIIVYQIEKSI